jgi:two-component system, cell cycle sensor histidine kinase and response regulator CckA
MAKANILIVEDESIIASVIAGALKKFGYHVIDILNTGEAAVDEVLQNRPDLILMDIRLQGAMDGIGAAEQILKQLDIPIIYLTAYADEPTLERAKKTRPYGYIPKPFQEIELKTTIEMALYKHEFEVRLKESEARFRSLFENSQDMIYVSDPQGKILEINPAGLNLLGYRREEILGIPADKFYADPEDRNAFINEIKNKQNLKEYELTLKNIKGDILYGLETANTMIDQEGRITGFQGIIRDVTESRKAELARRNLEAQLFQAQKMEAMGQLAGGVAHDFNNMLMGISGFVKFAIEQVPKDSPARDDLNEVLKLSKRAEILTRQLLAFSRRQNFLTEVLDFNRVVEEMMKMLGRLIGENIELAFVLAPETGNVSADPGQLEQVLMNLVVNARDAMPGGGKLTIETARVCLDENYVRAHIGILPGEYVKLSVSDTGEGMDENTRQHIFEPFFTTKPQGKGTGLGLSTVYGIVNQLKGGIEVDSEPGRGTVFRVYLPQVSGPAAEKIPETTCEIIRSKGTILIVEDDAVVRLIAQRAVEHCGFSVLTAASSKEADDVMTAHAPDIELALIDVVLPGRNGFKLAESWRREYPRLKVLFISGYMDNATVNNDILAHGLPFIQKPFLTDDLARKVTAMMEDNKND